MKESIETLLVRFLNDCTVDTCIVRIVSGLEISGKAVSAKTEQDIIINFIQTMHLHELGNKEDKRSVGSVLQEYDTLV